MRSGFTLLELLVATAMTVLIVVLFAEVFRHAVGTVRAQRALIANDERARSVTTTLRTDLSRMTFRAAVTRGASVVNAQGFRESFGGIVPLGPGDRPDSRQRGYFYLSENDPLDETDDLLQMTVCVDETHRDPLVSDPAFAPYLGRAVNANVLGAAHRNQPDFDDGQIDGAATSRAAEICYFLRGTTLYRRVMLIRDPSPSAAPPFSTQPTLGTDGTGPAFAVFHQPYALTGNSFYHDWDFSGCRPWVRDEDPIDEHASFDGELVDPCRFHFHGLESLNNTVGFTNLPLAASAYRFGFDHFGTPREYDSNGTYFGRFTHEETSHPAFHWPGINLGVVDNIVSNEFPLVTTADGVLAIDSVRNGRVDPGDAVLRGRRAGDDILLTGVEAFNIEVYDPGFIEDLDGNGVLDSGEDRNGNGRLDLGAWVDLGNSTGFGVFAESFSGPPRGNRTWGRQNAVAGPGFPLMLAANHVFDTWHPWISAQPPYRPLQVALPDVIRWQPGQPYGNGTVHLPHLFGPDGLPGTASVDDDSDTHHDLLPSGDYDLDEVGSAGSDDNRTLGFVVIRADGPSGLRIPEWPHDPGAIVRDGGLIWQCFDNRIGLESIRITIRFRDPASHTPRQVTLVHTFVE